jgi:hypothetical protein
VRLLDDVFRAVDFRALAAFFALDFLVAADFLAAVDRLADLAFLVAAAFLADFLVVAMSLLLHREEPLSPVCCLDRSPNSAYALDGGNSSPITDRDITECTNVAGHGPIARPRRRSARTAVSSRARIWCAKVHMGFDRMGR